ncbi:MAG TPA: ribonuclease III [Thermoflexus sp.]|nr:ribonuclease III [Thermoflexus sp.]
MGNWWARIRELWGHPREKPEQPASHRLSPSSLQASPPEEDSLSVLEKRLGWSFRNRSLLIEALTHRSYINEHPNEGIHDNERLEFLGDAVLQLVVSTDLFRRFPEWSEGRLTELRTALIRGERLALWAEALELGRWLRLGKGEAEGARTRPSVLADAFEALLGALYLDGGLPAVERLMDQLLPEAIEQALRSLEWHDPKGRLQHWSQAVRGKTPVYRVVAVEGPPHAARFTVQVLIGDEVVGEGQGASKREATREAARNALIRLGIENGSETES